jgi:hypothetical protein
MQPLARIQFSRAAAARLEDILEKIDRGEGAPWPVAE